MGDQAVELKPVLVADADAGVRSLIRLTLGDDTFRIAEAADTETAVVVMARDRPQLVVVDASLPGGGGIALARSLKAQPETRHARVVLLVEKKHVVDQDTGREAGVDEFLAKPFNAFALLKKVNELLSASESA